MQTSEREKERKTEYRAPVARQRLSTQRRRALSHNGLRCPVLHRQQLHVASLLHLGATILEVPLGHETPVQRADDPVLKTLNVSLDPGVDFGADAGVNDVGEGWNASLVLDEGVDGLLAKCADVVDRFLESETVVLHEDTDHVVGIAAALLDVVREDVLYGRADQNTKG